MRPEISNLKWFESIKQYGSVPGLEPIKKALWIIVAFFFGVLGAAAYYFLGRR